MKNILIASIAFVIFAAAVVANNICNPIIVAKTTVLSDDIKVKLQNKGKEKIEIFYQKKQAQKI